MKRIFIYIYLITIAFATQAQSYQTIYSSKPSIWQSQSSDWFLGFDQTDGLICGIKVNSLTTADGDSIFYHYKVIATDTNTSSGCLYMDSANWTGSKTLIKSTGENIFLNYSGDSIYINTLAQHNNNWIFYKLSDTSYFKATVTADTIRTFLGVTDSVKIITLNLINANTSNTIKSLWNDKQLILSKNYGLLQAIDFANFPNDTFAFNMVGITNPNLGVQNLTTKDVYNYNIGDEFDIETDGVNIPFESATQEKRIVIAKMISPTGDSVTYSYKRWTLSNTYTPVYNTSTSQYDTINDHKIIFTYDTLTETLPLKDSALDVYPLKVVNHDSFAMNIIGAFTSKYDNLEENGLNYNGSCYILPNIVGRLENTIVIDAPGYYKGLGSGYYYDTGEGGPASSQYYRELVYYKKGTDSSGTPFDFSAYLTGIIPSTSQQIAFTVFPNPFSESTTIKIFNNQNVSYLLKVLDSSGRTLREYNFTGDEQKISSDNLNPGMYYFLIINVNGQSSSGKLVVY